jgi:hypothetical protein
MNILNELQAVINELIAEAEELPGYEELEAVEDMAAEFNIVWEDR